MQTLMILFHNYELLKLESGCNLIANCNMAYTFFFLRYLEMIDFGASDLVSDVLAIRNYRVTSALIMQR